MRKEKGDKHLFWNLSISSKILYLWLIKYESSTLFTIFHQSKNWYYYILIIIAIILIIITIILPTQGLNSGHQLDSSVSAYINDTVPNLNTFKLQVWGFILKSLVTIWWHFPLHIPMLSSTIFYVRSMVWTNHFQRSPP